MRSSLVYLFLILPLACTPGQKNTDGDITKVKLRELTNQSEANDPGDIDLGRYKGKTVFVNFWATWCRPCIQEMPTIERAQEKLKNGEIVFLFASNEEPDQLQKFIKKHSFPFHYVHLENLEELKIQGLPTTFIFNREGKLKFSETGSRAWDTPENIELITHIMNDYEK